MYQEKTIRIQQAQQKTKLKKIKSILWNGFKALLVVLRLIYWALKFFDGDVES